MKISFGNSLSFVESPTSAEDKLFYLRRGRDVIGSYYTRSDNMINASFMKRDNEFERDQFGTSSQARDWLLNKAREHYQS